MISRSDIAAHLERGIKAGFMAGQKAYTPLRSAFCGVAPSDGASETYGAMGATPWPVRNGGQTTGGQGTDARTGAPKVNGLGNGGPIQVLGGSERAIVVYNGGFEIAIGIYHDAIDDDRVGELEAWAKAGALRFEQHKDFLAFDALNQGESVTTYGAGYDGLSFFNDSHIDPNGQYVTAQDNKLATSLSLVNFTAARVAASKFLDDRGQPSSAFNHNLLIGPIDLEYTIHQITSNGDAYDTANPEKNPYNSKIKPLIAPGTWLDSTAWFLVDANVEKPIMLQERLAPRLSTWDEESQSGGGIRYYKWYARYQPFYGNWRNAIQGQT